MASSFKYDLWVVIQECVSVFVVAVVVVVLDFFFFFFFFQGQPTNSMGSELKNHI